MDICLEYMMLGHHASGWKIVMMANAQHSQKLMETFTAHRPNKSISKHYFRTLNCGLALALTFNAIHRIKRDFLKNSPFAESKI